MARERIYLAAFEAPRIDSARTFVRNNIEKGYSQLVAIDGCTVVGWCDVTPRDQPTRRHCGVLGMGLVAAYRGQGNGELLIRATLQKSRDFGFLRVELIVHASNSRATALYRKVGFEVEGVKRRDILVDGRFDAPIMMALLF